MAMPLMREGVEAVEVHDKADVERILLEMWPENRIPVDEFHAMLTHADISLLKYHVGCGRTFYAIREIADLIWKCSNYERSDEFINN
ncbi:hypothetical protein RJD38_14875 [Vibrio scophthalmi]|uniref:hypothetical protein n=1 Tax=Vibrio scophthalmi TaxID=45658 RepID=UPI00349FBE6F